MSIENDFLKPNFEFENASNFEICSRLAVLCAMYKNDYKPKTLQEIYDILKKDYPDITIKDVLKALYKDILNYTGIACGEYKGIGKEEYSSGKTVYKLIDYPSSYASKEFHLNMDKLPSKILILSDTHITSPYENKTLINNIFKFGYSDGADLCFILGDFLNKTESIEEALSAINYVIENYKTFPIPTYCLKGNHEEELEDILKVKYNINTYNFDFRLLDYYIENFHFINKDKLALKFGGLNILLSHRFYVGEVIEDSYDIYKDDTMAVKSLNDEVFHDFITYIYDIILSGHLHQSQYSIQNSNDKKRIFISSGSASDISESLVVGYILNFSYDELNNVKSLSVDLLLRNKNNSVVKGDTILFDLKKKEKSYIRVLK